uniref:Helicase n=1 Tax=viral metagenome TaxID=1070528 RepID=A0A6M3IN11_9ZZZZ
MEAIMIKIKRQSVSGAMERQLLTAMATSDKFLAEAMSFYDPELIETRHVRMVAEWCSRYFQRYGKAPALHLRHIFDSHAEGMEIEEREIVETLLSGLSEEHERSDQLNVPYLLDKAEAYFKERSLDRLFRESRGLLAEGDVAGAEGKLSSYKRIGRPESLGANPFRTADTVQRAFEHGEDPLFRFPGKLGWMLNDELCRDKFLGFMGPEKRGKTWWLNEVAIRAAMARRNVILFQIGDMSMEQTVIRLGVRLASRSNKERYCGAHECPVPDCLLGQTGKCKRKKSGMIIEKYSPRRIREAYEKREPHEPCVECIEERFFKGSFWYEKIPSVNPLTWRYAWRAGQKFLGRIRGRDFRLSVHPSDQLSVGGLKTILDNLETFEGFIPDVIVIDYADNLAPEDRKEEYRHQQNRTWKLLRSLSQERRCLVVTATQADAGSYDQTTLSKKNFSEDKRKYAHVTAMVGLNQTYDEKKARLMRLNMIVQREGEFYEEETVTVAQDLWRGRPLLFSF